MKEIQASIDNWTGKDIWQTCNEFIREGVLYKVSNTNKTITHLSNRIANTERRAFLFDSLLILCKPYTKRIVPGRGDNSQLEWRFKERFFIRNIEIIERDDPYVRSNLSNFNVGHGASELSSMTNNYNNNNSLDQSLQSLSISISNISNHTAASSLFNDTNNNTIHAFEISETNKGQSIVLLAKTAEERDSWMSQLLLLNMRPMFERTLDAKLSEEAKKYPLLLPHPSVYKFAIEDNESNILLEDNKSNPNVPLIKGASLLKLIERLTYHKHGDPVFVKIFLTTYRSFCTPPELLKLLIERFKIPEPDAVSCIQAMHYANDELASPTSMAPPAQESSLLNDNETFNDNSSSSPNNTGPTSPTSPTISNNNTLPVMSSDLNISEKQDYREMLKRFRKEYSHPVQFRVVNVIRHWIDKHYYDFERDSQLLDSLNEFLQDELAKSHTKVAKWYHHIRNVLDRKKLQKSTSNEQQPQLSSQDTSTTANNSISPFVTSNIISNFRFNFNNGEEIDLLTVSSFKNYLIL